MTNQKDKKIYELGEKEKDFSKSVYSWLGQYEEGDDFLCGKVSSFLPEFPEEE
jgi:hypothetical protein